MFRKAHFVHYHISIGIKLYIIVIKYFWIIIFITWIPLGFYESNIQFPHVHQIENNKKISKNCSFFYTRIAYYFDEKIEYTYIKNVLFDICVVYNYCKNYTVKFQQKLNSAIQNNSNNIRENWSLVDVCLFVVTFGWFAKSTLFCPIHCFLTWKLSFSI